MLVKYLQHVTCCAILVDACDPLDSLQKPHRSISQFIVQTNRTQALRG